MRNRLRNNSLRHPEAQVSHFSTGTAALFDRRLHTGIEMICS